MADRAHHHAEGGGRLPLALAGVDDEEALLDRLRREDLVARLLLLSHLLGMARVEIGVLAHIVGHEAPPRLSSITCTLFFVGVQRPRAIASRNFAAVSVSAAGFASAMKRRTRSSSMVAA